jgi:hypothetical protein
MTFDNTDPYTDDTPNDADRNRDAKAMSPYTFRSLVEAVRRLDPDIEWHVIARILEDLKYLGELKPGLPDQRRSYPSELG